MTVVSLKSRLSGRALFSIEFFPQVRLFCGATTAHCRSLKVYSPDFASITYGAGGSTRSRTLKYARHLSEDYGYAVMPHLTCVGHSGRITALFRISAKLGLAK